MKSMTGYAYRENAAEGLTVSVEIKSYNSRFLDLTVNQPYWLSRLEGRLRDYATSRIQRGKVELSVRIREKNANLQVTPDPEAARAYMGAVMEIADSLGYTGEVPLSLIISQEGVLRSERQTEVETYWEAVEPVLAEAFSDFEKSRLTEGQALERDITLMIGRLEGFAQLVTAKVPELEALFKENIRSRFQEMLGSQVDEQRVLQETAALMVKYTINEEIVRLKAHLATLRREIAENPAPGRKTDFICQEINREVNTIGSKNQTVEIGQAVIEAKDALENIREQLRNVE